MTTRPHPLKCFKAYDIRGRIPDELNADLARRVGMAYAQHFQPRTVAVGHDIRLSSRELADAVIEGLTSMGVDVVDIGQGGTENIYFAAFHLENEGVDGGIMVTASHNPADYNGMKLVTKGAKPISGNTGLFDIEALAVQNDFQTAVAPGTVTSRDIMGDYVQHMLSYVDVSALKPLKIVVNAGNGGAGPIVDALEPHLPFEFIKVHHTPDGTFPNGVPNPLLEKNRASTIEAVKAHSADFGIAWDGDFDRCFFFDANGAFIDGYYLVGLLADAALQKTPGAKIIYEPRLVWNTLEMIEAGGGTPVLCQTGHAFIKERMRAEDAVYGGEMSAHHYFRDFAYCDSGMIPWLLVAEMVSRTGQSLKSLVEARMEAFPVSGEINRRLTDAEAALAAVRAAFEKDALDVDETDGLSFAFSDWRFNVRKSQTEPLVRLNVETRQNPALLADKTAAVLDVLAAFEA